MASLHVILRWQTCDDTEEKWAHVSTSRRNKAFICQVL